MSLSFTVWLIGKWRLWRGHKTQCRLQAYTLTHSSGRRRRCSLITAGSNYHLSLFRVLYDALGVTGPRTRVEQPFQQTIELHSTTIRGHTVPKMTQGRQDHNCRTKKRQRPCTPHEKIRTNHWRIQRACAMSQPVCQWIWPPAGKEFYMGWWALNSYSTLQNLLSSDVFTTVKMVKMSWRSPLGSLQRSPDLSGLRGMRRKGKEESGGEKEGNVREEGMKRDRREG